MAAAVPEHAKLYELNLSLILPNQLTRALSDLSGGVWSEKFLESLSGNLRNRIFILSAPVESWAQFDAPPVYAAVQVSLEGPIPRYPLLQEDEREQVKSYFKYIKQIPHENMIGAKIVRVSESGEHYVPRMVELLTEYYNSKMNDQANVMAIRDGAAVLVRGKPLEEIHYIGVLEESRNDVVQLWESRGFKLCFMGKHREAQPNRLTRCVMIKALEDYMTDVVQSNVECSLDNIFMGFCRNTIRLPSDLSDDRVDILLIKRMLKHYLELVKKKSAEPTMRKLTFNEKKINVLLQTSRDPSVYELDLGIGYQMKELAHGYFLGKLPIEMTDVEESLVIRIGLQGFTFSQASARLNIQENDVAP